jgi:hypothetical protein
MLKTVKRRVSCPELLQRVRPGLKADKGKIAEDDLGVAYRTLSGRVSLGF